MRRIGVLVVILAGCGGGHRHLEPHAPDPGKLYVEVRADEDALQTGADVGLGKLRHVVPVDSRGEIELDAKVTLLDESGAGTVCKVQVLILRLPKDSLLGSAEGSARAAAGQGDACVEQLAERLVRGEVAALLRRLLREKRSR